MRVKEPGPLRAAGGASGNGLGSPGSGGRPGTAAGGAWGGGGGAADSFRR